MDATPGGVDERVGGGGAWGSTALGILSTPLELVPVLATRDEGLTEREEGRESRGSCENKMVSILQNIDRNSLAVAENQRRQPFNPQADDGWSCSDPSAHWELRIASRHPAASSAFIPSMMGAPQLGDYTVATVALGFFWIS